MSDPLPLFGFDVTSVPDIDFCVKDASVLEAEVISRYEAIFRLNTKIAKTLGRGDPVRLFLLSITYQLSVQRSIIDSTGKENLLKYSHGDNLDNLGAKWGTRGVRLKADSAATTLRFTLSATLTSDSVIPFGTLAQSNNGIQFETIVEGVIVAGALMTDIPAKAVLPGNFANDLVPGQIAQLVSWSSPFLVSVVNTVVSSGGADDESDDHFRARIWMAPESLTTAGPKEAYEYWAASANPNIMDVSVFSDPPNAGKVWVYPLMTGGRLPTLDECAEVYAVLNADKIRPLTDQVFVEPATGIPYDPTVKYWIRQSDQKFEESIKGKVEAAYAEYILWQQSKIGRDVNPSKLDQMLLSAGAKRTDIPGSTTFVFTVVDVRSLAVPDPTAILDYEGLEDE